VAFKRLARWLVLGLSAIVLTAAPAAYASGGADSGGSGGGGGTSSGGGSTSTTTSCTSISNLSNAVGYYHTYAAIWTTFSLSSKCSGGSTQTWVLTFHNDNTGAIDYSSRGNFYGVSSYGLTVDDDFAPYSTPYTVTLTVTDTKGIQTSQSASALTGGPKLTP
jgi:hypothetical protein